MTMKSLTLIETPKFIFTTYQWLLLVHGYWLKHVSRHRPYYRSDTVTLLFTCWCGSLFLLLFRQRKFAVQDFLVMLFSSSLFTVVGWNTFSVIALTIVPILSHYCLHTAMASYYSIFKTSEICGSLQPKHQIMRQFQTKPTEMVSLFCASMQVCHRICYTVWMILIAWRSVVAM